MPLKLGRPQPKPDTGRQSPGIARHTESSPVDNGRNQSDGCATRVAIFPFQAGSMRISSLRRRSVSEWAVLGATSRPTLWPSRHQRPQGSGKPSAFSVALKTARRRRAISGSRSKLPGAPNCTHTTLWPRPESVCAPRNLEYRCSSVSSVERRSLGAGLRKGVQPLVNEAAFVEEDDHAMHSRRRDSKELLEVAPGWRRAVQGDYRRG
jgi:hypothetical protein